MKIVEEEKETVGEETRTTRKEKETVGKETRTTRKENEKEK